MKETYGDQVRIIWKHFPLVSIHKDAYLAHVAAVAAGDQGKFWEYNKKLFGSQPKIQKEFLLTYAKELGLDMKRFEDDLNTGKGKTIIDADVSEGRSLGLSGTPAFFVNGKYASGAKRYEEFVEMINAELTKLNLPIPKAAQTPDA